ncbi:MAG: ATPase [Gammaproteobacteria bacterium]|nr:ATPase [Gammaproteobacteria bacterium]
MSLRTLPAHWFELLVPRPQLPQALDLLARSGQIELEARPADGWSPIAVGRLQPMLIRAQALQKRFAALWPAAQAAAQRAPPAPAEARLSAAIQRLEAWRLAAEPQVNAVERVDAERGELGRIADFLECLGPDQELNFGRLARPGEQLSSALLVLPIEAPLPPAVAPLLLRRATSRTQAYALILGPQAAIASLTGAVEGRQARLLRLPEWLEGQAAQALAQVRDRIGALERELAGHRRRIETLSVEHRVAESRAELDRLQWLTDHLSVLTASEHLARVTGWTLAPVPEALLAPLLRAGIAAVAGFSPPPAGHQPPTLTGNPRWARPFELFLRLAGTPGRDEADPSMLVAVIAPLLFGYMFGDIGQGAVLCVAGLLARRRWPAAGMLIPGGLLAIVFGWLFGSVFASSRVAAPVWTDPIHDPLPVLTVPLAFGAALIVLGLALNAVSLAWSGRFRQWLADDAGLLIMYLAGWSLLLNRQFGVWAMAAGALWFVIGAWPRRGWRQLPARFGGLVERLLQMAVNTLSFIRVGAFALAHTGLSLAVAALADVCVSIPARLLAFALGNLVILGLEGLVVGIQTTRLVLFEFFIRFVRGGGRPFRPLPPPAPV